MCHRTLAASDLEVDHLVALIDGGADEDSNVRPLCRVPCHRDKSAEERRLRLRSSEPYARTALAPRSRTAPDC